MNDQDLERALRAQRGPREEGYVAADLPASIDESQTRTGPRGLLRAALIVPAALAGVLTVAIVGSMLSGGAPFGTNPEPSASSFASSTAVASVGARGCNVSDSTVVAEPWSGAAGSRGTVVTVALTEGHTSCTVPTGVVGRIVDGDGSELVRGENLAPGGSVLLEPGASFAVGVAWSNWCESEPDEPLTLTVGSSTGEAQLLLFGWTASLPIDTSGGGANPVPPCNGDGPATLSLTALQPQD